jgi:hypothetical protein
MLDSDRIPVQSLTTLMVLQRCHIEAAAVGIDTVVELKVIARAIVAMPSRTCGSSAGR